MNKKKNKAQRSAHMQEVSAGLQDVLGMNQWRHEHPQATLREIEAAVDEHINRLRAQLIQEIAQMSVVEQWSQVPEEERPTCTRCRAVLVSRGKQTRWLQTNGGEALKFERSYGTCPDCGQGIFPPR